MSETISETRACDLLARIFRSRGYAVSRNVLFREYGVEFHADGWDPRSRVGFEFLSSEDDDHDDLTLAEYKALMDAQQRGELSLFIIDEVEPLSAGDLAGAAEEFLDEVAEAAARRARRAARADARRRKPGRKKAARAGKSGGRKTVKQAAKARTRKKTKKKTKKKVARRKTGRRRA